MPRRSAGLISIVAVVAGMLAFASSPAGASVQTHRADLDGDLFAVVTAADRAEPATFFGAGFLRAGVPDLSVTKSAPAAAAAGRPLRYEINIENAGRVDAADVLLTDRIPERTAIVPGSVSCSDAAARMISDDPVILAGMTVPAGSAVRISFRVTVDESTPVGTVISNQALAVWDAFDYYSSDPGHPGEGRPTEVTVKSPVYRWYLAEGSFDWGFSTELNIENPNDVEVTARMTMMPADGSAGAGVPSIKEVKLAAQSRTTVNLDSEVGARDFSTEVECLEGLSIAVDRTVSWGSGRGRGAHNSIGVNSPSKTWYLPEGSSAWGFESWTLVQNANPTEAHVTLTYMIEGAGPGAFEKTVPACSRRTFSMKEDIGEADASIMVTSDVPVIPERSMYRRWTPPETGVECLREGHCSIGTTAPATDYYLAEGSTAWGFTTYVLVQNPNRTDVGVTLTYMTQDGPVTDPEFTLMAGSRRTVRVNDRHPDTELSVLVHSDGPIVAERAMYWTPVPGCGEAMHDSIGTRAPHRVWYLPEGETSVLNNVDTYTCVQNPGTEDVEITITYFYPWSAGGPPVTFTGTVPAGTRRTYPLGDKLVGTAGSIMVTCDTPGGAIIAERSVYYESRWSGTSTIGGHEE